MNFYAKYTKRLLDFILSLIALIILCIPMLIVALLIRLDMGSPVLFRQERITKDKKPFMLYKFRSMKDAKDKDGINLPDEERLTKLGRIIRKTSIDELPSLLNILKGEMSIVGPRPLPTNYLPWFTEEEQLRHTVRGGLTGLAQVNGRGVLDWDKKFAYDVEYVKNMSLLNDIKILIRTVQVVLRQKDIGTRGADAPKDFDVERSGLTELQLVEQGYRR